MIRSAPGEGSVFRFEHPCPVFACAKTQHDALFKTAAEWTYWTDVTAAQHSGSNKIFEIFERYGWKRASRSTADIIIDAGINRKDDSQVDLLAHQILLRVVSAMEVSSATGELADAGRVVLCGLPLYRNRVIGCLQNLARFLAQRDGEVCLTRSLSAMDIASRVTKRAGDEVSTASAVTQHAMKAHFRRQLRLLLVDDNDFNLKILQMYCKKRGYDYTSALDGLPAYELYVEAAESGRPYSFCILDLQMPTPGDWTARKIREYERMHQLEPCLIYMVTAQSGDADRATAKAAGCDGYHVKPLRIKVLDELLSAQFDLKDGQ